MTFTDPDEELPYLFMNALDNAAIVYDGATLPIAWPGETFDPSVSATDGRWLIFSWLPNKPSETSVTTGSGGFVKLMGLAQVTVNFPTNSGLLNMQSVLTSVKDMFPRGTNLIGDTVCAKIYMKPYGNSLLTVGAYDQMALTIPWLALVAA